MSRALVGRRHLLRSGTFIVAVLACGVWCAAVAGRPAQWRGQIPLVEPRPPPDGAPDWAPGPSRTSSPKCARAANRR